MFQSYNYFLHVSYIFFHDSVYATYMIMELTDGINFFFFQNEQDKVLCQIYKTISFCFIYMKYLFILT